MKKDKKLSKFEKQIHSNEALKAFNQLYYAENVKLLQKNEILENELNNLIIKYDKLLHKYYKLLREKYDLE